MQRSSNQDSDGVVWSTASLRLGTTGMDLRRPSEPPDLADLVNARFLDERTVQRRNGFTGQEVKHGGDFPVNPAGGSWIYGFGQSETENTGTPFPIQTRGALTFNQSAEVVWTGDRFLTIRDDGNPALGASTFWQRAHHIAAGDTATTQYPYGVPGMMPLETYVSVPLAITADWIDSALTPTLRVHCLIHDNVVTAVVMNRATGMIISSTALSGTFTTPAMPTVISSNGTPAIVFLDTVDKGLRVYFWTGTAWTAEEIIDSADTYDVVPTSSGMQLLWRYGATVKIGYYSGVFSTNTPALFGTTLTFTTAPTTAANVALAWHPDTHFGVAYNSASNRIAFEEFTGAGVATYHITPQISTGDRGLAIAVRDNYDAANSRDWVIYAADNFNGTVDIWSTSSASATVTGATRYNSEIASRAFAVGDEVFCWLKSRNSATAYLLAGATHPVIAGYADREVAETPKLPGTYLYWPARVHRDPADFFAQRYTWSRRFNAGNAIGNTVAGDLDFLPHPTTCVHGRATYISGSAVKLHDGVRMYDAGWQDYPVVDSSSSSGGGSLNTAGHYQYRVYAVRYTSAGERIESPANTYTAPVLSGDSKITLTIHTVPSISGPLDDPDSNDVILEVYRNTNGGTTFYLEGTVAHTTAARSVTFVSSMADADLDDRQGDPHAAGTGNASELESWGPLGCAVLTAIGDRVWGSGGQVPPGQVQFSKLKNVGFVAGFDDLAGTLQVDNEGGRITSVFGLNNAVTVHQPTKIFVYGNTGPDNYGVGGFGVPQLVLAAGATTHHGTGLCQAGQVYWGSEGPLLLDQSFTVQNISSAVWPFTTDLTPTGVQIDTQRMEAVWFCGTDAVLWNWMSGNSRWARWTTPDVADCSPTRVLTSTCRLLTSAANVGDDGVPFAFSLKSGNIRPENLLQGHSLIRRVGITGEFNGAHRLRFREFYDGSPCWTEEYTWDPTLSTWLLTPADLPATPLAIDSLTNLDRSGAYVTNKRLARQTCSFIQIEISDISASGATYTPYELAFEVGAKPGLARVVAGTFT